MQIAAAHDKKWHFSSCHQWKVSDHKSVASRGSTTDCLRLVMLAESLPIIAPAPKGHAKDLPGWRLLLGVQPQYCLGSARLRFRCVDQPASSSWLQLPAVERSGRREVCADDSNEKVQAPDVEPALWPQPQSVGEACRHSPGVKTGASMRRCRRQATHRILAPLGGNGLFLSAG